MASENYSALMQEYLMTDTINQVHYSGKKQKQNVYLKKYHWLQTA